MNPFPDDVLLPVPIRPVPAREDVRQAGVEIVNTGLQCTDYSSKDHYRQGGCAAGGRGGLETGASADTGLHSYPGWPPRQKIS